MAIRELTVLPLLAASLTLAGCSGEPEQAGVGNSAAATPIPSNDAMSMSGNDGMSMNMKADANDLPATVGYKKSMSGMMASMPPFMGDADADFMRQMKVHHGSAIAMAEVELRHGKDAKARALAEKIIGDQRAEIAEIDAWLAARK